MARACLGSLGDQGSAQEVAPFYPTYASFEALDGSAPKGNEGALELVPLNANGEADIAVLNREFTNEYLDNPKRPRWVAKPTVAYLWARTVSCKNCRATIPLLKTRWLCKKPNKRVVLEMTPKVDRTGVEFAINHDAKVVGQNAAARREHDKRLGVGTMSRSGAKCPCCGTIMMMEDLRVAGRASQLGATITTVVVDGKKGKQYRLPSSVEIAAADAASRLVDRIFEALPFGLPTEPLPKKETLGFRVPLYGYDQWAKLFVPRQLAALGLIANTLRSVPSDLAEQYASDEFREGIYAFLICAFDRMLDFNSMQVSWITSVEAIGHTFVRYALPMTWDYSESAPSNYVRGGWRMSLDAIAESLTTISSAANIVAPVPRVVCASATTVSKQGEFDVIVTDPPYYDAIPYSDLMDYFYVWDRRLCSGPVTGGIQTFASALGPKWDSEAGDGELIDDSSRFGGDAARSKKNYEDGMRRSFEQCHSALTGNGRLVIVFAHKHPDAWETLVGAIIRSGFVVDGSWPIQTEQAARMRAQGSAALASSVWLVCRKRPETARPGWDNLVLEDMHRNITQRLREFWDAGIRGPDFVWSATGPALEAYSQHPVVKKANSPGELMSVTEFLQHVRRIVVDFVVGRVLSGDGGGEDEASGLDDVTTYYLLHRHDFGLDEAPAGACILYAVSCGLTDRELSDHYDLVSRAGGVVGEATDEEEGSEDERGEEPAERGSGSELKLRPWNKRASKDLGLEAPRGKPVPLIDQVHRIMRLWKAGDVVKVNEYLDQRALRANKVFHQLLQALIELAPHASEERSLLESISNHVAARGVATQANLID